MDYEKKNKEVLEGVKKIHSGIKEVLAELGNSNLLLANILNEAVWALNKQFPELTESEDDRMRKNIIKALEILKSGSAICTIDTSEEIDWFKKQKEQKPVHTAKEIWKEMRLEVYAQASGNRHEPNYSDDSTKMFSLCDIDEIFEKIGDSTVGSQPAEWSEEDEKPFNDVLSGLKYAYEDLTNHKSFDSARDIKEAFDWMQARLKSLRPSWKPSEEQMEALMLAIEGKCSPTSYMSRRLEDLYEGLVNTYDIKENYLNNAGYSNHEQASKDLEEAAEEYVTKHLRNNEFPTADNAFIAGARWQKEQMLKDAVEMTVGQIEKTMAGNTFFIHGFEVTEKDFPFINSQECGYGDKVKIVIIPEKEDKK